MEFRITGQLIATPLHRKIKGEITASSMAAAVQAIGQQINDWGREGDFAPTKVTLSIREAPRAKKHKRPFDISRTIQTPKA